VFLHHNASFSKHKYTVPIEHLEKT